MYLDVIIKRGRAVIISPYVSLNMALGLYIAHRITESVAPVYILSEYNFHPSLLSILPTGSLDKIVIANNLSFVISGYVVIAILKSLNIMLFRSIAKSASDFFILTPKFNTSASLSNINVYKVRKVCSSTYSIQTNSLVFLIRIAGNDIVEEPIPQEIERLVEELRSLIKSFGSVKASVFVKYMSKKYGYSREKCLELLRRSILMGIVRYENGYLTA